MKYGYPPKLLKDDGAYDAAEIYFARTTPLLMDTIREDVLKPTLISAFVAGWSAHKRHDENEDEDFCEHGIPRDELCNNCRRSTP